MNDLEPTQCIVESILAEHRELQEVIGGIKKLLSQRNSEEPFEVSCATLKSRLTDLSAPLGGTFCAREEHGGFLEEAVTKLPRLAQRAIALEQEHPDLLCQLDKLLELIPTVKPSESGWKRLAIEYDRIARQLANHEATENHLLEEGFNQAIGL